MNDLLNTIEELSLTNRHTEEPVLFLAGSTTVLCDGLQIARNSRLATPQKEAYTVLCIIFFILLNLTVSTNNYFGNRTLSTDPKLKCPCI